jgi:hypothetical protein
MCGWGGPSAIPRGWFLSSSLERSAETRGDRGSERSFWGTPFGLCGFLDVSKTTQNVASAASAKMDLVTAPSATAPVSGAPKTGGVCREHDAGPRRHSGPSRKFTQWRPAPGKRRGAHPTGLGRKGSPARSSVRRVKWRSHSGSRANQRGGL